VVPRPPFLCPSYPGLVLFIRIQLTHPLCPTCFCGFLCPALALYRSAAIVNVFRVPSLLIIPYPIFLLSPTVQTVPPPSLAREVLLTLFHNQVTLFFPFSRLPTSFLWTTSLSPVIPLRVVCFPFLYKPFFFFFSPIILKTSVPH